MHGTRRNSNVLRPVPTSAVQKQTVTIHAIFGRPVGPVGALHLEIEAQLVYGYGVTASEVLHGAGEERLREEKSAEPEIVGFAVVVPVLERESNVSVQ